MVIQISHNHLLTQKAMENFAQNKNIEMKKISPLHPSSNNNGNTNVTIG